MLQYKTAARVYYISVLCSVSVLVGCRVAIALLIPGSHADVSTEFVEVYYMQ
jgi:hypothetical protein